MAFIAEDEAARLVPLLQKTIKADCIAAFGDRKYTALLRGLDGIRLDAVRSKLWHLRMLRDNRLQNACAHFNGLLHHIIKPPLF
ncbi:hypothetical protein FQZ97_1054190 [compost metagenome]